MKSIFRLLLVTSIIFFSEIEGSIGQIITTFAGGGGTGYSGEGVFAATSALFNTLGLAMDRAGNIYIAENARIRLVDTLGVMRTFAGNSTYGYSGDGGPATAASLTYAYSMCSDTFGNFYLCQIGGNRIRKINPSGVISTIAGTGTAGYSGDGGLATGAMISQPTGIVADNVGNVYFYDAANYRVRRINSSGVISTLAGNGSLGYSGDGGPATAASFGGASNSMMCIDNSGNLYVADVTNHRIRRIDISTGVVTLYAGNGGSGSSGDGGPATAASIDPRGINFDRSGNLYLTGNSNTVRKINTSGIITTVAGTGIPGFAGDGGLATAARLSDTRDVVINIHDNFYINDFGNNKIREVLNCPRPAPYAISGPSAVIRDASITLSDTLAGGWWSSSDPVLATVSSSGVVTGGVSGTATISYLATNSCGSTVVVKPITVTSGYCIPNFSGDACAAGAFLGHGASFPFKIIGTTDSLVDTSSCGRGVDYRDYYGVYSCTMARGAIYTASYITGSTGVTSASRQAWIDFNDDHNFDSTESVGVADGTASGVRTIPIAIPVGSRLGLHRMRVMAEQGGYYYPYHNPCQSGTTIGTAVDYSVTIVDPSCGVITTIVGNGLNTGALGYGGPATNAELSLVGSILFDASGNIFIADGAIRKVNSSGIITKFAGGVGAGYAGDGGPATAALLRNPTGIASDAAGNLVFTDRGNHVVRKIATSGIISTLIGTGTSGFSGDGGPASAAQLYAPYGIAFDGSGNFYIADANNNRIRKVNTSGIITTFAGGGTGGDGGQATAAVLNQPWGVATDGAANVYILERGGCRLRKVSPSGIISTIAGTGTAGFSGDGGSATAAMLNMPTSMYLDPTGVFYISDYQNHRIRKVTNSGIISTIAGTGVGGFNSDGTQAQRTPIYNPLAITADLSGNIVFYDYGNLRIRKINGSPTPIGAISGATSVGVGSSITLSDTTFGGIWSSSNNSIASVSSSGIVYGVSAGTATITYSVLNSCGVSLVTSPMTVISYCTPTFGSPCSSYSMNISVKRLAGYSGVISDTSACTGASYENMTAQSCSLVRGTTYTGTLYVTGGYYATYSGQVWIDFNDDGTFAASETVAGDDTFATSTPAIPFVIPAGATLGTHRMRIVGNYSSGGCCGATIYPNMNPCPTSSTSFGDARDYTVTIVPGTPAITASPDSLVFGCTAVGTSLSPLYTYISGSYLTPATGYLTVTAPTNFEIWDGSSWVTTYTISYASATVTSLPIAVRFTPSSIGITSGYITISGGGTSHGIYVEGAGCPACTGTPSAGTAVATVTTGCTPYSSVLSLTGLPSVSGLFYQWQTSSDGSTWTNISGACVASYTVTVSANTYYRCTVVCTASGGTSYSVPVLCNFGTPTIADITGPTKLCVSSSITLTSATTGGSWSTSTPTIATIGLTSGTLTGLSAGVARITYSVTNACGTSTRTRNDTVVASGLTVAAISGSSSVCVGANISLTDATPGGTWSHTNAGISTVSVTGTVTGLSAGTDTIKYFVPGYCTATAVKVITVTPAPNAGTISGPTSVCIAGTGTYTTTGTGGTWSIAHPSIATINATTGVVTGLTIGADTIFYTVTNSCGTTRATYVINITVAPNAGTITGASTVCIGATTTFSSSASGGVWTSSNNAIASVTSTGIVRGNSAGTATITYTVTSSCGSAFTTKVITVGSSSGAAGTISGPTFVCVGSSITLTDTVSGGLWSTSTSSVATVNTAGIVTGLSAGTAVISYNVTGSCGAATATYTIAVGASTSAGAIVGPTSVCPGATITLSNATGGGAWSSSNVSVATINTAGVVTGISAGTTTITYLITGSCGTGMANYTITVNPAATAGTITGTSTTCVGSTITLADAITGGVWSSSNNAIASVSSTGVVRGNTAGTVTISYTVSNSCGTATATSVITITSAPTAGTISGPSSVCTGSTITLTNGVSGGAWSSSNLAIATVDAATGVVTGITAGSVTISYTITSSCGVATATTNIAVNTGGTAGTIIGSSFVCPGASITLSNTTPGGTWSSSNTARATVSTTGVVTGVSAGAVTISYTITGVCGTTSATKSVAVNAAPNAGTITGTTAICIGLTTTLTNAVAGGVWSSSNPAIASVTTAGVVRGNAAGTATISYSVTNTCGTASATTSVNVSTTANAGTLSGASTVCTGISTTYTSTVTGGVWSSSNASIASVNSSTGAVTGIASGTATITYTITNTCGTATATSTITVNPSPTAAAITGTTTLCTGANTTLADATTGGVWSSSNVTIASVNPVTGVVTGITTGSAIISYTVTNSCGSASATTTVTVNTLPSAGSITGATIVCPGSSSVLTDAVSGGTWSSSNPAIVTVSAGGSITGVAVGSAIISYTVSNTCGSVSATTTVSVLSTPSAGTITGTTTTCAGGSTTLADAVSGGVWSSSNTSIATVSTAGVVTGITAGTVTISYRVSNSCGVATATATVTVTSGVTVAAITGTTAVCVGATSTLTDATPGGIWVSNNPTVASITSAGVVRGNAVGSAIITYAVTNSCGTGVATISITVNGAPTVAAIAGTTAICAGSVTTLTNATTGGTWSSSNPSVASITSSGVVRGNLAGTATITYAVTNSCGTTNATATVTVSSGASAGTITGAATACTGTTITYANTVTGGTWSSSNATIASVNPSTGIITAVAAGTVTISYTVTSTCGSATATKVLTVSAGPAVTAITGTTTLCVGTTTTLSNTTTGGVWSSSNTAIATVNTSTGVVSGVSTGSATITYTITASCGTITRTATVTVNSALTAGTINGTSILCAGTTTALTSTLTGGTWSTSNAAIASVNASTGVVSGVASGSAVISYTVTNVCGTATATFNATVSPAATTGAISGATTLCTGASTALSNSVAGGTWSTSNAAVVSVTTSGIITGLSAGTATISYTVINSCGTSTATKTITVSSGVSAGTISGPTSVCTGASVTLSSTTASGTWSSSNVAIATINPSTGVVTGVGTGSATITYAVTGSCGSPIATRMITVNPTAVAGTISGLSVICIGNTTALTSSATGGTWSSSNPAVASVTATGTVRGNTAGSATISYSVTNSCGTVVATKAMTVTSSATAGTLSGATGICTGSSTTFTSTVSGGTWLSSNTSIATVNSAGVVTGVGVGTATITYTVVSTCGTTTSTKTITVSNAASSGTISGPAAICAGTTVAFTTTGTGGTWSSSNTAVASVTAAGMVTGLSNGSATISYTVTNGCGTVVSTANVTVSSGVSAGVITGATTLCPSSPATFTSSLAGGTWSSSNTSIASVGSTSGTVYAISGGSATITYTVTNGCGTTTATKLVNVAVAANISGAASVCVGATTVFTNPASGGTWSSNNNTVATISTTGVVGGVAAGTTTISYIMVSSCGTTIKTASITVNPAPNAGLISGVATMVRGTSATLTQTVTGGTWSSSNTALASISTAGVVNAIAAGIDTIKYTVSNSCGTAVASKTITITNSRDEQGPAAQLPQVGVNIYPNPASAIVHIAADVKVNIIVLTSTGRVVVDQKEATDIDLSSFADGMYMIMVYDAANNELLKAAKLMKVE